MRLAQAGLALVAANVANANTPGFVRKTLTQSSTSSGQFGAGVRVDAVNRELDAQLQRQLRTETAGGSYADVRAQFYDRLQQAYGQPGTSGALETTWNGFASALEALTAGPQSASARSGVLNAAGAMAQQLNAITKDIQSLRANAESGLADSVQVANTALGKIAQINRELTAAGVPDQASAVLKDERDQYIDQLSQLMDIRVATSGNQLSVFTSSGVQLAGLDASRLAFTPQGVMDATAQWDADPAMSGLGSLQLVSPDGSRRDLFASSTIRSGKIAAYAEMRDGVLVGAQAQIDAVASAMSQALSDRTVSGSPAASGAQSGFDVDIADMLAGNSIRVSYTDTATNTPRSVTLVRVDDPAALPLPDPGTGGPNDRFVGISFAGGSGAVAGRVAAALGAGFAVSNPGGTTLRILDDGSGAIRVDAASTTKTATTFDAGSPELPFFLDNRSPFSGAPMAGGKNQMTGFAGRIALNPALLADPAKLIAYAPGVAAGDTTRPEFLVAQLTGATQVFPPRAALGGAAAPYRAPLPAYIGQMIASQGQAAASAASLKEGQGVVVSALSQRWSDTAGVNIDQEMAGLLALQNAYAANARVMSAVKEMLDLLSKM